MAKIYPKVFFNDKVIDHKNAVLNIASSAVLYGLSVYTVFPICLTADKKLVAFRLGDHFKRLKNSAKIIGIDFLDKTWNYQKFEKSVVELISKNNITEDVFVRATVHVDAEVAGTRSRGLSTVLSMFIYEALPIVPQDGARLKTSVWRRIPDYVIPSRAKVNGAYVNSVLAKQDAIDSGYDDCILLDSVGHVCELSAANIFLVRNGQIITPDTASDLLEGINRRTIIELASELKIPLIERAVDLTELYVADEIFTSGTSAYVATVTLVDARTIGSGKSGEITSELRQLHLDILHGEAGPKYKNHLSEVGGL